MNPCGADPRKDRDTLIAPEPLLTRIPFKIECHRSTMDDSKVKACFEEYLKAVISKPRLFAFLRQTVGRSSQIENARQYPCHYSPADASLHVKSEEGATRVARFSVVAGNIDRSSQDFGRERDKAYPVSSFEKIEWGSITGQTGTIKYINIVLRDDRTPIILHAPTEVLELWYDGLRLLQGHAQVETPASNARLDVFKKAVGFAALGRSTVAEDPPLPPDYNFVAEFPPATT
jgi:hypothetical protein